ncbi:DUF1613-domain-containing protein [Hanseniaspora valbyensis NRRL Y-1626]|uniref:tRNA (uracil-O(2)-)-methyltransferase n=1 Tax=Hanseniaspora valbyensis NRRL Y-1626 TaxID=766949 RepID=A0A1B7TEN9_9ASCO|nr:DUF1613-domain-containing protein [Hanseniaspora valbyensis NRRL Y-1626]
MSNYEDKVNLPFNKNHFIQAMDHVIQLPNINSTIILRADILSELSPDMEKPKLNDELINQPIHEEYITMNIKDIEMRLELIPDNYNLVKGYVRRMFPRNPFKDEVINQTCLILENKENPDDILIQYTPHIEPHTTENFFNLSLDSESSKRPFYIPNVKSVGINYTPKKISCLYLPLNSEQVAAEFNDPVSRLIRTSKKLLETAVKHSIGCKTGYVKQSQHDKVVPKVKFQDRYLLLKQMYGKFLFENWCESTDPQKHVFEEIAVAAFLIELWLLKYGKDVVYDSSKFEFKDLGCGNGTLIYVLIMEGISGEGIDARERKSWKSDILYPENVKDKLKCQLIVPKICLNKEEYLVPNKNYDPISPNSMIRYTKKDLEESDKINTCDWKQEEDNKKITFIIGNHSDELTCWIPLLGYPFMVLPCCSHDFNGKKKRFYTKSDEKSVAVKSSSNSGDGKSTYASLVDQVVRVGEYVGWKNIETQMIRIPSTRNIAIISTEHDSLTSNKEWPLDKCQEIIDQYGGCSLWVVHTLRLILSQFEKTNKVKKPVYPDQPLK